MNNKKHRMELIADAVIRADDLGIVDQRRDSPRATLFFDLNNVLTYDDLVALMEFDDENFSHDIIGVQTHIVRNSEVDGKVYLGDCFRPRCMDAHN